MYIPKKPAKYGLKIILACDVNSKYMFDACPYLGKNSQVPTELLGAHYCKLLTQTIHGTNRNITADSWFMSVPLAEQLLAEPYKLTFLGTIKANKKEIPSEFKHDTFRRIGASIFGFHDKLTLVSFKPNPQKTVLLISTMHDEPAIDPVSKKPFIITAYNKTKGAVDTFDQMCGHLSCNRKTRRWPLCIFYGMINMAVLNSFILHVDNSRTRKIKPMNRRACMKALSDDLIHPRCAIRGEDRKKMRKRVREAIDDVLNVEYAQNMEENIIKKKEREACATHAQQKKGT
ncbi:PiggyBac transposable element-derived protein 4 [Eumeta japonica]|uniref:PiggyBac transposable element-derived protein 4 n=1 Tax=Eumeta variegata TaxID=151549 RepID=A0A4C1TPU0_EUMVA|nr:PiggyBac transposable element-derived protein 4 [Eumeta japonica]